MIQRIHCQLLSVINYHHERFYDFTERKIISLGENHAEQSSGNNNLFLDH
jgi:hypothetical protein